MKRAAFWAIYYPTFSNVMFAAGWHKLPTFQKDKSFMVMDICNMASSGKTLIPLFKVDIMDLRENTLFLRET